MLNLCFTTEILLHALEPIFNVSNSSLIAEDKAKGLIRIAYKNEWVQFTAYNGLVQLKTVVPVELVDTELDKWRGVYAVSALEVLKNTSILGKTVRFFIEEDNTLVVSSGKLKKLRLLPHTTPDVLDLKLCSSSDPCIQELAKSSFLEAIRLAQTFRESKYTCLGKTVSSLTSWGCTWASLAEWAQTELSIDTFGLSFINTFLSSISNEVVSLALHSNNTIQMRGILLNTENTTAEISLVTSNQTYPDFLSLIPSSFTGKVKCSAKEIVSCLTTIKKVVDPNRPTISVSLDNVFTIRADDIELTVEGEIETQKPLSICFNATYLLEILKPAKAAETVTFSFGESKDNRLAPTLISFERDRFGLVMPCMRL